MPPFIKAAELGDKAKLGLEGDPLKPHVETHATVVDKFTKNGLTHLKIKDENGVSFTTNEFNQNPAEVFEFTDDCFRQKLEKKERQYRADEPKEASYRGTPSEIQGRLEDLESQFVSEKQRAEEFRVAYLAAMAELCKTNDSEFAKAFTQQFNEMQSRAEEGVYRGANDEDAMSMVSETSAAFF